MAAPKKSKRGRLIGLIVGVLAIIALVVLFYHFFIQKPAGRVIQTLRAEEKRKTIRLKVKITPLNGKGLEVHSHQKTIRYIASPVPFNDLLYANERYYLATDTGVLVLDNRFREIERWTHLSGLNSPSIRHIMPFKTGILFLSHINDLYWVEGENLHHFSADFVKDCPISAIGKKGIGAEVILGTLGCGLWEFDGARLSQLYPEYQTITALYPDVAGLIFNTAEKGLFMEKGGGLIHLGSKQGLPTHQIQSILKQGEAIYLATPYGLFAVRDKTVEALQKGNFITTLLAHQGNLLLGTYFSGVIQNTPQKARRRITPMAMDFKPTKRIIKVKDQIYFLTENAIYQWLEKGVQPVRQLYGAPDENNFVTTLAVDPHYQRLWVGYFDSGIRIYHLDGRILTRVLNPKLRFINHIVLEAEAAFVATNQGVFRGYLSGTGFKSAIPSDRLISPLVSHILKYSNGYVVSTSKGLTLLNKDFQEIMSLNAFHGLLSNRIQISAEFDGNLLVGTLNGLNVLKDNKVIAGYGLENSKLLSAWISALAHTDNTAFIGTYGKGAYQLDSKGLTPLKDIRDVHINQNAMKIVGEELFIGTLEKGLLIYHLRDKTVRSKGEILPSQNVTAFARFKNTLFIGTDIGVVAIENKEIKK